MHFAFLFAVIFLTIIDAKYEYTLRGIWTNRLIIIMCILTGIASYLITLRPKNLIIRAYFFTIIFSPILCILLLFYPFLMVVPFSLVGRLIDPVDEIYYEDKDLRIQSSFVGVLGPPWLYIKEKKGLFEKNLYEEPFAPFDYDSVAVNYESENIKIIFYGMPYGEDSMKVILVQKST
ncbi:MAG: hypothetical protein H7Y00_13040 [Fimbriimonadaceae bacterium]|nr:hypothetical protein [Chitinophagales bacterium]